ncbi:hypothetical protein [Streptomyces niveus]|uniref:hypothetical protein n=1 Tax=Streptomyces niveus TaxID=193462 RepID=UPI0035DC6ADE
MPVEPIACDDGGSTPVEVTTCCSPSIASAPLCRADGSTVLVVVRSGCVECGEAAEDPAVVGWLDVAGVFTPGALPANVGPCDAGCVDTVCRQLCDDTDGDGTADATYSELWCIRADGTAELVLTYQDDPSVPYIPAAPVDCTYGCPDSESVTLCDDTGPFLRRYTWLQGVANYEDFALDGITPHVVTGTVGVCDTSEPCEAQTTPAATLGLCLADGTPIAVVVTRDCDGTVTQDGWLTLTTGAYSAGDPPAGTMACGNPRSITTAGTFCDVDPGTGDVLGLVLIEYTYGADGAVASVRLVDAITGTTYVPQGEVTTCPAGVEQPERDLVQLCDTAVDGTITPFVRDYARDENGQITGHTDYTLAGAAYAPTGDVGQCTDPVAAPCQDCTTLLLCDTDPYAPATIAGTAASGTLANGITFAVTAPSAFPPGRQSDGAAWWGTALFPNPTVPVTRWTFDQPVTVDFSIALVWSTATTLPGENSVQLPAGAVPLSLPPGYSYNRTTHVLRGDATLTGCTLNTPTRAESARFRVAGVSTFTLQYLGSRVLNTPCRRFGNWEFGALDVSLGGPFLRTTCRDCHGAVTSVTDTLLDGTTAYTPVGAVGVCSTSSGDDDQPPETRLDVESHILCLVDPVVGTVLGQVLVEQVYDDQTGLRTEQRITDPTTGDPVALPAGAILTTCHAPAADGRDVELTPMCVVDTATGNVLQRVLAEVVYDTATGDRVGVNYVDPVTWGPIPIPGGAHLDVCPDADPAECRNTTTLLVCDVPTDGTPAATVTDTDPNTVLAAPQIVPFPGGGAALWSGGTLALPAEAAPAPGQTTTVRSLAAAVAAPRPACDTGTATVTVTLRTTRTGPDAACAAVGHFGLYNGTTMLGYQSPVPNTPVGHVQTLMVTATVPAADVAAGNLRVWAGLETYDAAAVCTPSPRSGGWTLDQFATDVVYEQEGCAEQFLRSVVVDCATGAPVLITDTTLDGAPYTATGQVGQCTPASSGTETPPCGDTELVQLCDLTYDPQAPIPTPAGDFTLTGNVVAANSGTTLWFAQANQEANGTASLTVSGLLPTVLYEFSFASAWIGPGNPNPAANNAIYLLEILDGTTVLATRTRNTSNGSNVYPGGFLTEDLPPLAFVPPPNGTVTIRFTDQTTGGPTNDRDLFLMPLELRTAALTVTSTLFLRRFTFNCDGELSTSQDLDLDGTTPYEVAGEVGQCADSGDGSSVTVPPCDANTVVQACRCDDTDGDGIADTDYVELIGVDCDGALTSLGTYTADLSAPYTPVAPIACNETDEGAEPAHGVQARRVELSAGQSWDAAAWPTLQSVTAIAHGATGTVTTRDGTSTLHIGEAATWSVARDADASLTGPLVISAGTGTVTLSYTIGVTL